MTTIRTGGVMVGPAAPAGAIEGVMEGTEAPEAAAAAEGVVEVAEADIPGT